jgi:luciferase family oxidoreductase group 1
MRLSVLDQSTTSKGQTQDASIRETLALAQQCEALGYHRYWLSEHHNSGTIVGTAPEVLMAAIAATTTRIRIGSAGVMLPHYSALKVAEQFRVLEALAPGRIDLGVGRAPGSDRLTSYALNPNPQDVHEQFPAQIMDLQAWLTGTPLADKHPFREIVAHPTGPTSPDIWVLGSSDYGAQLAAHFGVPYAFAYFFADGMGVEDALAIYRDNYKPSARHPEPQATICVFALAADTEAEARRQYRTRELHRLWFERNIRLPLVPPEEAATYDFTPQEQAMIERRGRNAIVGSAAQVAEKLTALAGRLALDELVINTWTYDPAVRLRSYELIATAFGLTHTPAARAGIPA